MKMHFFKNHLQLLVQRPLERFYFDFQIYSKQKSSISMLSKKASVREASRTVTIDCELARISCGARN